MARYLDEIVAWHRARLAADTRDLDHLARQAHATLATDPPRAFQPALTDGARVAVIAEIKRRSPSKGDIDPGLDPAALAREYERGGAACLSVLTDGPHFGGSAGDLAAARAAVGLPVLRKDFTLSAADVHDARLMGADAVLLIVAALGDADLMALSRLASELGMAALVEVHDEAEAARACDAGATLLGVNQRDLRTFEVDAQRAARVVASFAAQVTAVAESGIRGADDVAALGEAGFDAVLVGETLLRAAARAEAVRELAGAGHRRPRPRSATAGAQPCG